MPETLTPDQYLAKAAMTELNYARQQVKEMHQQVERLKQTAERIIKTCDWLLSGDPSTLPENY